MKIMFDHQILCTQKFGGISRYFHELYLEYLKDSNIDISIPLLGFYNYYFQEDLPSPIRHDICQKYWRTIFKLNNLFTLYNITKNKYDIIHSTYFDPYILRRKNGKLIITIYDMIPEIVLGINHKMEQGKRKLIFSADHIIAISHSTKRDILRTYPEINPSKISVVYLGVDKFPEPQAPSLIVPDKYILFVGTRNGYKNFHKLLIAMCDIIKKDRHIFLLCTGGEDTLSQEDAEFINRNHIQNNIIHMMASDAELAYLYQNALCFVYPSLYEGFGLPLLEAMNNNCPVIAGNSSSLPEVGGDAALYVDACDVDDIRNKLIQIIDNQELRSKLIKKGCEQIKFFSYEITARETLKIYKKVLNDEF